MLSQKDLHLAINLKEFGFDTPIKELKHVLESSQKVCLSVSLSPVSLLCLRCEASRASDLEVEGGHRPVGQAGVQNLPAAVQTEDAVGEGELLLQDPRLEHTPRDTFRDPSPLADNRGCFL